MKTLLKVSIRNQAVYLPLVAAQETKGISRITGLLVTRMAELGYGVSEPLLKALEASPVSVQQNVLDLLQEVTGVHKNWTPLVKGWDTPTGESVWDHVATFFTNLFNAEGTKLVCGHVIPAGTFPLERYNGCPYCGMPFESGELPLLKQGSKMKVLELWGDIELNTCYDNLLSSKTALDATQADSLKILLAEKPLPNVQVGIKETLMLVIDVLVNENKIAEAGTFFKSPTDVLRYLWFKKTGLLQLVSPKTIIARKSANHRHFIAGLDVSVSTRNITKDSLKLKYSRKECAMLAAWINGLPMEEEAICETMHPKRDMWVRFIRALRLAEYAKKKGFEKLSGVLDRFYREDYTVWESRVSHYRLKHDAENALSLLRKRPGLFARSLFANMLWFGKEPVVEAFEMVLDKVPMRLLLTLQMYAADYFDKEQKRIVRPLGGVAKIVPANSLLSFYTDDDLQEMQEAVKTICLQAVSLRFARQAPATASIYIDPALYNIPVSIGERSQSIQDAGAALMGTKFSVEGDTVRLFMQWGVGLPAQHLDMDLSCTIAYEHHTEICSFGSLAPLGCKHSGDIRQIPSQIGTAEYIDVNLPVLRIAGARYVVFTCNAYSGGSISPNLVVGWMNSSNRMAISEKTGVAYDPSCVQHQVRITSGLQKGLVFGVLDVSKSEITWLEMDFQGQVVQQMNYKGIPALLKKLESRISIGQLLKIKAIAQQLEVLETPGAEEVFDLEWASDTAAVTKLLID